MTLSRDERALLTHIAHWGSDGYPVSCLGPNRWSWGPWHGIKGPNKVFPRKRDAVASFEAYLDILREKAAEG